MNRLLGFSFAIFACTLPLLGFYVYVNGPEWVQLADGFLLLVSGAPLLVVSVLAAAIYLNA